MAKRHKHYDGRIKSKNKKKSNFKKANPKSKGKVEGKKNVNGSSWVDSTVPGGGGDLNMGFDKSVEDYYFGKPTRNKSHHNLRDGVFRPGYDRNADNSYFENSSFRKRPMVFIKSEFDLDSANEKLKKLIKINNKRNKIFFTDIHNSNESETDESDVEVVSTQENGESDGDLDNSVHSSEEPFGGSEEESGLEVNSDIQGIDNNDLFFIDDEPQTTDEPIKCVEVEEPSFKHPPKPSNNVIFDPILTVGKVELTVKENIASREVATDMHPKKAYHPFREYISNVMENMDELFSDEDEFMEDEENCEVIYSDDSKSHPESIIFSQQQDLSSNIESLNITEHSSDSDKKNATISPKLKKKDTPEYPEFGFCSEDFVINTNALTVSNIRFGAQSNSYYFQAYDLYGDNEFRWADQDILIDFILETMGLPEHRLDAYLDYIRNLVVPDNEPPEPNFDNIPFSDTSEEEESDLEDEDKLTDDRLEGIDDLVHYALKYGNDRQQEYETKSLQTTGKGTKKKLLIRDDIALDKEIVNELQNKLSTRLENKANKKKSKQDFIEEEYSKSEDLFKKYPYGLHVLNIKDEFDFFYNNKSKNSLSFPPLDPHGNKTIRNFAKYYSLKTNKIGTGKKMHIQVSKIKITYRRSPNYNVINNLTKQRPIFLRFDVAKPQNEHKRTERISLSKYRKGNNITKGKFHVTEGQIVGQDAPEIGHDNIGMRMLVKLGWSKGEGLGTGGQGISQPVFATVKTTKKGLGHQTSNKNEP